MTTPTSLVALATLLARQDVEPPSEPLASITVETLAEELEGGAGGLEVDADGFVYCADFGSRLGPGGTGGDRVFKIDPETGEAEVFVDGLRGASGNAFGPEGDFFQSNIGASTITRVEPDGTSTTFLQEGLVSPVGIAIDDEGTLFVANCGSNSIVAVTADGASSVFCSSPLLACPNGITMDDEHNLYVSNFYNGNVIKISWGGEASKLATLPGNNNGHLAYRGGHLYVVARGAHQIFKVSMSGEFDLFAGSGQRGYHDGPAVEARFSYPNDVAFSPDGSILYVNENASVTEPHTVLAPMRVRRIRISE